MHHVALQPLHFQRALDICLSAGQAQQALQILSTRVLTSDKVTTMPRKKGVFGKKGRQQIDFLYANRKNIIGQSHCGD